MTASTEAFTPLTSTDTIRSESFESLNTHTTLSEPATDSDVNKSIQNSAQIAENVAENIVADSLMMKPATSLKFLLTSWR